MQLVKPMSVSYENDFGAVIKYHRKNRGTYDRNSNIILLLCENSAFMESEAMEVLTRTPEGIELIYFCKIINKNFGISRVDKTKIRKSESQVRNDPRGTDDEEYQDISYKTLIDILKNNDKNIHHFAKLTINHLMGKTD
ncbi:jg17151 [Pararge aegeria aegeria]|uniref:Jg17151 protein n=1 Tax=Pararge aegeria aegeria TaxID=348720 RepID=A0A8S4RMB8_9NEOP|nr:jg17151 [Pararge aegeria aegeria]